MYHVARHPRLPAFVSWVAALGVVTLSIHEPSQVIENVATHMHGHDKLQCASFLRHSVGIETMLLQNLSDLETACKVTREH